MPLVNKDENKKKKTEKPSYNSVFMFFQIIFLYLIVFMVFLFLLITLLSKKKNS